MSQSMRIATWNVQRPRTGGWKNIPAILKQIREIKADIWILTETNSVIYPGEGYTVVTSKFIENFHALGEAVSSIWSRYPIKQQLKTFDSETAVCAELETNFGNLLVYGTIITWANDRGLDGTSKKWEEHYKSIHFHNEDWAKIDPNLPLCVAGDFNECLSKPYLYGTKKGGEMLTDALAKNNLVCVTANDEIGYNIDHICLSAEWAKKVSHVNKWQAYNADGKTVSDHYGISIDLCFE